MAVKIRLSRQGAKKRPQYQVVVVDNDKKRDGEFLDTLGHYFPKAVKKADKIKINVELTKAWLSRGAQPTETVGQLIRDLTK